MKLYNTLTRKIEDFQPITNNSVKLYTCGPTVYDYYHIGNLRNAVFNDTLRRTLEANEYNVSHVMNITDVGHLVSDEDQGEDKLEKGAKREGKTVWEVAAHYTDAFKNDMEAMNVLPPNAYKSYKYGDNYARATDFIEQQIEMIKLLIDKSFAYRTKQAIYFDVTKLQSYGELSGQKLSDKEIGARAEVVTDPDKLHPHDFAVWFFAVNHFANHTMQWESPWGNGFPGWHLECSAIIHSTLNDPIDIHTGGIDHIGTHHPNEMAQTEGAFGHKLSNYWVHNEFVLVDGSKMAKSKGNSYTLIDVTNKGFNPLALRLLYLQANYRTELNFSWENLEAANNRLKNFYAIADLRWQLINEQKLENKIFVNNINAIKQALNTNLNTTEALVILNNFMDSLSETLVPTENKEEFENFLNETDQLLGLNLSRTKDISDEQKHLLISREEARSVKNWEKSDKIRLELESLGIGIRDTSHGQIWFRT